MRGLRGQIKAIWRTDTIIYNAGYIDYFDCTLYTLAADQITINREIRKQKYFISDKSVSSGDSFSVRFRVSRPNLIAASKFRYYVREHDFSCLALLAGFSGDFIINHCPYMPKHVIHAEQNARYVRIFAKITL